MTMAQARRGVGEVEGSGRVVKVGPTGLAEMGCGYKRKQVPGNPEAWGLNQRAGIGLWREGGEGSEEGAGSGFWTHLV